MSKNELENQIFGIKNNLTKIEEGAERKELYIKNKLYKEYAPKFTEIESTLQIEQNKLGNINRKIEEENRKTEELLSVKKELIARIKEIKRKDSDLNKEKTKKLNAEVKAIGKEKHTKMNVISKKIKTFEKELKAISH